MCQERLHNQVDEPNITEWYNTGELVVFMCRTTINRKVFRSTHVHRLGHANFHSEQLSSYGVKGCPEHTEYLRNKRKPLWLAFLWYRVLRRKQVLSVACVEIGAHLRHVRRGLASPLRFRLFTARIVRCGHAHSL